LLDRDGVINERVVGGYVTSWAQFVFLPDALEALRLLAQSGYQTIVVSNQACVAKGLLSSSGLEEITRRFIQEVEAHGGRIGGVYYCPHQVDDGCECRKPRPGLLLNAQKDHGFDFAHTFFVGDSENDLLAACAVGCPALLIAANTSADIGDHPWRPRAILPNLLAAVQFIINGQIS
jgi:D-glycero-D-manno-heptose 1,7-bisphosphate phosphatase